MAIGDILSGIGKGVETVGRVAGAVAAPLGKAVAEEEAGYAPQIAAEKRKKKEHLEDEEINAKAQALENQLSMGQKYGTLTSDQQKQYVDSITQLYSHPRHAPVLMEKLRKAIHPQGTHAQAPSSVLPNAMPEGGTAGADARMAQEKRGVHPVPGVKPFKGPDGLYYQPMYDAQGKIVNEQIEGYAPPPVKSGGKSPPLTGDRLPGDAVGANGEPIPEGERTAGKSFVEFAGAWWPVAKSKPVFKTVKGHSVLVDSQSGAILRDLGPTGSAKITTRQTLQPGDDGQMHLVNLTSVTTPEGAQIEVEPETGNAPNGGGGENKPPIPAQAKPGSEQQKPKRIGGILPKQSTGAKPVANPPGGVSAGKVVPGLSTLAHSKNPLFKSDVAAYTKANNDLTARKEAYISAQKALSQPGGPTASSDQELIYSWVRANVQGAGRMTQAEFKQAANTGSLPLRAQSAWQRTLTGRLPGELEQMMLADIKRNYETSQQEVNELRSKVDLSGGGTPASSGEQVENWGRDPKTGKLVKQ